MREGESAVVVVVAVVVVSVASPVLPSVVSPVRMIKSNGAKATPCLVRARIQRRHSLAASLSSFEKVLKLY